VLARYHALVDSLSFETPGESTSRLAAFLEENRQYQVADSVEAQIVIYRGASAGLYHQARAQRDGEFDRAEQMLKDPALVD
jgi:hypothetical protein